MSTTIDRLIARFDGREVVDLIDLTGVLGKSKDALYQAHHRGRLGIRIFRDGRDLRVALVDVASFIDNPISTRSNGTGHRRPAVDPAARTTLRGRPTNEERRTAAQLGISIAELRLTRMTGSQS